MLIELLKRNRSYRRFRQEERIANSDLMKWVSTVRYTASMRNAQPLKYRIISDPSLCAGIFPLLGWAGYLSDWDGPEEGERPAAYLIQLLDKRISQTSIFDEGIQLQAISLAAVEDGYGACIIKNFKAAELADFAGLPEYFVPTAVMALGIPVEEVQIEELNGEKDIRYWRTEDGVHHVPKRSLSELIV